MTTGTESFMSGISHFRTIKNVITYSEALSSDLDIFLESNLLFNSNINTSPNTFLKQVNNTVHFQENITGNHDLYYRQYYR